GGKQVGRRLWRGRVIAAQRPPDHNRYHVQEKRPTRAHDPCSTGGDRVRACAYLGPAADSPFMGAEPRESVAPYRRLELRRCSGVAMVVATDGRSGGATPRRRHAHVTHVETGRTFEEGEGG